MSVLRLLHAGNFHRRRFVGAPCGELPAELGYLVTMFRLRDQVTLLLGVVAHIVQLERSTQVPAVVDELTFGRADHAGGELRKAAVLPGRIPAAGQVEETAALHAAGIRPG